MLARIGLDARELPFPCLSGKLGSYLEAIGFSAVSMPGVAVQARPHPLPHKRMQRTCGPSSVTVSSGFTRGPQPLKRRSVRAQNANRRYLCWRNLHR